jgi:hypothetical protein
MAGDRLVMNGSGHASLHLAPVTFAGERESPLALLTLVAYWPAPPETPPFDGYREMEQGEPNV